MTSILSLTLSVLTKRRSQYNEKLCNMPTTTNGHSFLLICLCSSPFFPARFSKLLISIFELKLLNRHRFIKFYLDTKALPFVLNDNAVSDYQMTKNEAIFCPG